MKRGGRSYVEANVGEDPGYGMMKLCGRRADDLADWFATLGRAPARTGSCSTAGPERPIFGKVRCMSPESPARRVRLRDHIRSAVRWPRECGDSPDGERAAATRRRHRRHRARGECARARAAGRGAPRRSREPPAAGGGDHGRPVGSDARPARPPGARGRGRGRAPRGREHRGASLDRVGQRADPPESRRRHAAPGRDARAAHAAAPGPRRRVRRRLLRSSGRHPAHRGEPAGCGLPCRGLPRMGGRRRPRAVRRHPGRPPETRGRPRGAGRRPAADRAPLPAGGGGRDRERPAVLELDRARRPRADRRALPRARHSCRARERRRAGARDQP